VAAESGRFLSLQAETYAKIEYQLFRAARTWTAGLKWRTIYQQMHALMEIVQRGNIYCLRGAPMNLKLEI
jgi:hypothetical protein